MSESLPGNRFIAASWRPGADRGALGRLRNLTAGWTVEGGEGWLIASEKSDSFAKAARMAVALGRPQAFDRGGEALVDAANIAARLAGSGPSALGEMASPFRAVWADGASGAVGGSVDRLGIGHVFTGQALGFAALASSATSLGALLAAPLSPEAISAYAMFGNFLVGETPFAGVVRLAAGQVATLKDGHISTAPLPVRSASASSVEGALRASVAAMLKAAPAAELELSGGLDSRLILAAMTPSARAGIRAVTLGVTGELSDDVRVAQSIAAAEGLDWSMLDVGGVANLDADGLDELLATAVVGYDHMANPLEKTALIFAGRGREVTARFSGQNGEILRGFYYPRQPLGAPPSEALARRLIELRVSVNDRVDDRLLAPAVKDELAAAARDRVVRQILGSGAAWAETLDHLYLDHRMQNWVGNAASSRLIRHVPLYPFFDADFIGAALREPAREKLNSRRAYRLLQALDAGLARMPLADGATPAALPKSAAAAKIADIRLDVSRGADRVWRRVRRQARTTLGSTTVADQWRRLELYRRLPLDRLARTGLFDEEALASVGSGAWLPSRPSLGFLLVVAGLVGSS